MKVFVLPSNVVITPFNEPAADSLIVFENLHSIQEHVFGDRGLQVQKVKDASEITQENYFLTFDNVYTTRRAFRDFFKKATKLDRTCRMALPESAFTKRYGALQGIDTVTAPDGKRACCYDIWYVKKGQPIENAEPVIIRLKEMIWSQPVPPNMFGKRTIDIPITTSIAFHVTHWVTLLWANQMGILVKWVERITNHRIWTAWKLLKALVLFLAGGIAQLARYESLSTAFGWSSLKLALFKSFNKVGRNCEIHPDAIVQFCLIGDNVKIGPQSYVFGSIIGDGVIIEEKTKITLTSLAPGCYVSQLTVLNGVATYPDGDVCIDGMQFCLSGRKVKLTGLARPLDIRTDGPIKVPYKGKPTAIGQEILGSCFGHDCFIGPDVYIAPGREIPNGTVIIQPPGHVLFRVPPDITPGMPMVVEDGTLKPFVIKAPPQKG